jgi:hypothetical protein
MFFHHKKVQKISAKIDKSINSHYRCGAFANFIWLVIRSLSNLNNVKRKLSAGQKGFTFWKGETFS